MRSMRSTQPVDDGVPPLALHFSIQKDYVLRNAIHLNVLIGEGRDKPVKLNLGYGIIRNLIYIERI